MIDHDSFLVFFEIMFSTSAAEYTSLILLFKLFSTTERIYSFTHSHRKYIVLSMPLLNILLA